MRPCLKKKVFYYEYISVTAVLIEVLYISCIALPVLTYIVIKLHQDLVIRDISSLWPRKVSLGHFDLIYIDQIVFNFTKRKSQMLPSSGLVTFAPHHNIRYVLQRRQDLFCNLLTGTMLY